MKPLIILNCLIKDTSPSLQGGKLKNRIPYFKPPTSGGGHNARILSCFRRDVVYWIILNWSARVAAGGLAT